VGFSWFLVAQCVSVSLPGKTLAYKPACHNLSFGTARMTLAHHGVIEITRRSGELLCGIAVALRFSSEQTLEVSYGSQGIVSRGQPGLRAFMSSLLRRKWYEITAAGDGATALQKAASERPDIVFLDLGLPDMSGVEVI
jgi:hypothetical protein